MKLLDSRDLGVYTLDFIGDEQYAQILKRYGFIPGAKITIVLKKKGCIVVDVLDCKYSINKELANIIFIK